jgi:GNAT superfamily N-acetyltransferase
MRQLTVRRESIESRDAHELVMALNAELAHRYPEPGANHFRLDPNEVLPGRGAFVIARTETRIAVGCGAIRRMDGATAEIKRMFVIPKHRGMGAGHAIVEKLEQVARELGVARIVLETGERQPEAIALYEHCGFVKIPRFGEYTDSPLSICMEKTLQPAK